MISEINASQKVHRGGGLWGKILGGLAGLGAGIATVATGGAAASSIPLAIGTIAGATSTGSALGGMAGEAIDKTKATESTPISPLKTAFDADPIAQAKIIADSQTEVKKLNAPTEQKMDTLSWLEQTRQELMRRGNRGGNQSSFV